MLAGHTAVSAGLSPPHACKQRSWELHLALSPLNLPTPVDERSTLPFVAVAFIAGFALMRILAWRDRTVDELLGEETVGGVRILTR